jgi:hypothetical protein
MWVKGFTSSNVNGNLSSYGCPLWSWLFVVGDFERIKEGQWAQKRNQSDLTF